MANVTRTLAVLFFMLAIALGIFAFTLARAPAPLPASANGGAPGPALAVDRKLAPVVIAARDLQPGKPLDAASLTVRMQAEPASGVFGDTAALTGRTTRVAVPQGTPLTVETLSSGLADVVEPGERAVAVRVDETNAVGNLVRPGNFVDVFFTLKREGGGSSGAEVEATQARLLLSKVRVLSVGGASVEGVDGKAAGDTNQATRNLNAQTAVLAVRTADVDALTLAESSGRLVLALRNTNDAEMPPPQSWLPLHAAALHADADGAARAAAGVSLGALSGARAGREPVTQPRAAGVARAPRSNEVEVIRGGRGERTAY
ncbi:Flp pilus assembly protein CpaB [Caballeronia sp. TF1N1]|uniref:Flp pilus assembly protein CpaB n=1 Tax=Caballeronia sp. TF1N1 TaxID=2878153 RepID=UPI001FD0C3A8|nr:Flp pilus assembly protein CpaB [Caballeronia sp. TF1N1]